MKNFKFIVLCIVAVALLFACSQPSSPNTSATPDTSATSDTTTGLAGTTWIGKSPDGKTTYTIAFGEDIYAMLISDSNTPRSTYYGTWNLPENETKVSVTKTAIEFKYEKGVLSSPKIDSNPVTFTKQPAKQNTSLLNTTWKSEVTVDGSTYVYTLIFNKSDAERKVTTGGTSLPRYKRTYSWSIDNEGKFSLTDTTYLPNTPVSAAYINGLLFIEEILYTKQ